MTRLEALIRKLADENDRQGDYFFDPIPYIKEYLAERDATSLVTPWPPTNPYAQGANDQLQLARIKAEKFDNEQVAEPETDNQDT